jgi:hypothetical protein
MPCDCDRLRAPRLGQPIAQGDALVELADEPVGAGHVGHVELVIDALVHGLERGRHFKNDALLLARHHVAGGEAAAVAHAVDAVLDGRVLAGQQEVGVHRMHRALGAHREAGGHQRLAEHLAAEHGGRADVFALGQEAVAAQRLELHERDEFVDEAGGGGGIGGHRAGTVQLARKGNPQP